MSDGELWVAAALPFEGAALERRLAGPRESAGRGYCVRGNLVGRPLRLVVTGPGARRVHAAYEALRGGRAPRAILSTGVAGALRSALAPGQLVLADEIVVFDGVGTRSVGAIDSALAEAMARSLEKSSLVWERASVLACDEILASGDEKQRAGCRSGAAVVQMEDHAWADRAHGDGTAFLSLRCVIDTLSHDIVPAATQFPWRGATPWQVAAVLARNPGSIPGLVRLRAAQKRAASALAEFSTLPLERLVAELSDA